jgi:hypothetical protein
MPLQVSQQSVKTFTFEPCSRKDIKDFVEKWHYSKSINGVKSKYCFKLLNGTELIGAAIFGEPATKGIDTHYVKSRPRAVIELRRLCCIDATPKNTESYFIGCCLRWMKHHTDYALVVSYSDLTYGHEGIIYKASNFKYGGQIKPQKLVEFNGRLYHDRCLRVKYKDGLKPFAQRLVDAVDNGQAKIIMSKCKNIYTYILKNESQDI